jgi:hypothetical protein
VEDRALEGAFSEVRLHDAAENYLAALYRTWFWRVTSDHTM